MKRIFMMLSLCISFVIASNAQTIIDYTTWGTNQCNAFNPAAIVNSITHNSTCGTPKFDNVNKAIELNASAANNIYKGTEYKIAFNFKQYHTYTIKLNVWTNTPTFPVPNSKLRVDFTSASNAFGSFCNGVESFNTTSSLNNNNNQQINPGSFYDLQFQYVLLPNAQSNLFIGAFLNYINGTASSWVLIKKVTITETPPPLTFTISPTSTTVNCGTSVTKTFTVSNVYNSPGTLVHTWNLGANNGWLYQGNPAPATITTNANNSITLTSVATATTLSNVNAVVNLNGSNVSNLTSNVSLITPGSNYTILGNDVPCRNIISTYTLQQTPPSGTTVTWSILPNDGTVTLTPSGNSVDVDASNASPDGYYILSVSINGNCYKGSGSKSFVIYTKSWSGNVTGYYGWTNPVYNQNLVAGDNYLYTGYGYGMYFEIWNGGNNSVPNTGSWNYVSGDRASNSWIPNYIGYDLWTLGGVDSYYDYTYIDNCGTHTVSYHFITTQGYAPNSRVQINNDPIYKLKITPNPASSFIQINIEDLKKIEGSKETIINAKSEFDYSTQKLIKIYDKMGVLVLQQKAIISKTGFRINVSNLRINELYNVIVEDGKGNRLIGKFMK